MVQTKATLRYCMTFLLPVLVVLTASAQTSRLMPWGEYKQNSYRQPYILNIYTNQGGLLYFGVQHSDDPIDEQFTEIEIFWNQFNPDIAFNEGGDLTFDEHTSRSEAIRKYGDPGIVRYLAFHHHVPVTSMEPTPAAEIAELLRKKHSPEQVKIFYILRDMAGYDGKQFPDKTREQYLQGEIARYNDDPAYAALKNVRPNSVQELEPTFTKYFPGLGSYDNKDALVGWVDPSCVHPSCDETLLNTISSDSTDYRDHFMVDLILRTVCQQKRVFVVVGWSHVVRQEPALRALLSEKCSH